MKHHRPGWRRHVAIRSGQWPPFIRTSLRLRAASPTPGHRRQDAGAVSPPPAARQGPNGVREPNGPRRPACGARLTAARVTLRAGPGPNARAVATAAATTNSRTFVSIATSPSTWFWTNPLVHTVSTSPDCEAAGDGAGEAAAGREAAEHITDVLADPVEEPPHGPPRLKVTTRDDGGIVSGRAAYKEPKTGRQELDDQAPSLKAPMLRVRRTNCSSRRLSST